MFFGSVRSNPSLPEITIGFEIKLHHHLGHDRSEGYPFEPLPLVVSASSGRKPQTADRYHQLGHRRCASRARRVMILGGIIRNCIWDGSAWSVSHDVLGLLG